MHFTKKLHSFQELESMAGKTKHYSVKVKGIKHGDAVKINFRDDINLEGMAVWTCVDNSKKNTLNVTFKGENVKNIRKNDFTIERVTQDQ